METKYCQSFGMPLKKQEDERTNLDGNMNDEYCCYYFKEGAFTMDCTMEQMIEHCAQFVYEFNKVSEIVYTKEQAIKNMKFTF